MQAREKVKPLKEAAELCRELRSRGRRIVFTNGCFDLLHLGHLRYLEEARALGDYLIVAVNSDASVRRIKGGHRPLVDEKARSELVAGLHCVDCVVLFDAPNPLAEIQALDPHVLVKGADWPVDQIVGADWVIGRGGTVVRIPVVAGYSTSRLIEKILRQASCS
ncbi:D-glycero-beta-D-manno-heptose 1-phosphate adenylyltransferase [Desulfosoma sp.]|uniref:D-glycero-beta-D-manno-heptose 1-phosphate adenylyltransferase n=1 Tax=Desulfosoma sp. TaxID=2603217 RepID=UPI00404B5804